MAKQAPGIVATCQQTRFHLIEDKRSSEVAIQKLNLSIVPQAPDDAPSSKTVKTKAKSAKALEILVDADLKLKGGVHYGLLGRNGTGKSTLLRAMGSKLIPGLSYATKISVLQQTSSEDQPQGQPQPSLLQSNATAGPSFESTVLDYVINSDTTRTEIEEKLQMLRPTEESDDERAQVLAYRSLRYAEMQKQFAEVQKNATLRSGARGSQARKDLIAFEKAIAGYAEKVNATEIVLESDDVQNELLTAAQRLDDLQVQLDEVKSVDAEGRAKEILGALGFDDRKLRTPVRELSGGWQMRTMLASVLLQDADVMILDEPTNFLDMLGILWLQKFLSNLKAQSGRTVVVVSHDRDFIDNVCEEIILLKDQSLVYFDGNLTEYEQDLDSRRKHLTTMKEAQEKQTAHIEKTIAQNIKAGKKSGDDNKLRQAVSRQKKLDERSGMQVGLKGGRFKLNRDLGGYHFSNRAEIEIPPEEKANKLSLPEAPDLRFPGPLISLDNVSFSYSRKTKPILQAVNLTIHAGQRVGVVGLNGSGKTTLIQLITNQAKPTTGTVTHHPRLKIGYYSQLIVEDLRLEGEKDTTLTALTKLASKVGESMDEGSMRGLLGSFGLPGRVASDVPVSKLSGGQLVRLALACVVSNHPHLLILDEITTHLDFYTVIALSKALRAFNGAILLVSHDRYLMKTAIEGDTSLLADEDEELSDDEEERLIPQRALYILRAGKLTKPENGVSDFENSLEKKLAKLSI